MASSLSSHFNNLSEGINKIKCKYGHDDVKRAKLNINIAIVFLGIQILKMI